MAEPRRFPPPWTIEDNGACFIVRDHNGQPLAYVYYEEEPGRRSAAKLLTRDEAWRIAANVAKLPELLRGAERNYGARLSPCALGCAGETPKQRQPDHLYATHRKRQPAIVNADRVTTPVGPRCGLSSTYSRSASLLSPCLQLPTNSKIACSPLRSSFSSSAFP